MKGIIHVHSKGFSYDARLSFDKIKIFCKKHGFKFVFITEHSNSMSQTKMKMLAKECKKLSDSNLLFVPGIEIQTKEGFHVLGLGVEKFLHGKSLKESVNFIHRNRGIAILAHPHKYETIPRKKELVELDGIEVWNFEYDGYFPRMSNLDMLKGLRKINEGVFGYTGLDLHWQVHMRNIFIDVNTEKNERKGIVEKIRNGDFNLENRFYKINPSGDAGVIELAVFPLISFLFDVMKKIGLKAFRIARKLGIIS